MPWKALSELPGQLHHVWNVSQSPSTSRKEAHVSATPTLSYYEWRIVTWKFVYMGHLGFVSDKQHCARLFMQHLKPCYIYRVRS